MNPPAAVGRSVRTPHRRSAATRWRRGLALLASALLLASTTGSWLANTATGSFAISLPAGMPASGNVADVTPMTASLVGRNGGAQLDLGVNVARIAVTPSYANRVRITIAWVNVSQAHEILGNANAYVLLGVYRPVSMSSSGSSGPCISHANDPILSSSSIYDDQLGATMPICVVLDQNATGTLAQLETGKLLLSRTQVSGFLEPSVLAPASALNVACTSVESGWCQAFSSPGQAVYYIVATLVAPGGGKIPSGVGNLKFYVRANALP